MKLDASIIFKTMGIATDAMSLFSEIETGSNPDASAIAIDLYNIIPTDLRLKHPQVTQSKVVAIVNDFFALFTSTSIPS